MFDKVLRKSTRNKLTKDIPGGLAVKNLPPKQEMWIRVRKIPWGRKWQPTPVFLPGESPWTEEPGRLQLRGHKESDRTECLSGSIE